MSPRQDLLAMTPEVLSTLTNRGLVKRALREVESGTVQLDISTDRVVATFPGGPIAELAISAAPGDASCSCGSAALCRHRVALVLAYRAKFSRDDVTDPDTNWTPGEFSDHQLKEHVGTRTFNHARQTRSVGYAATVHRSNSYDETVRVDLAQSTVQFLVPHRLEHAHTSAVDHAKGVSIVLAVWAVREADQKGTNIVHVGGALHPDAEGVASAGQIVSTVLTEGTAHLTPVLLASLDRIASTVTDGSAMWLSTATAELIEQLGAYRARHSLHSRRRVTELLVEVNARVHLSASPEPLISRSASGVGVPGETPIGRATLTALGAHVTRRGATTAVNVYFFDRSSLTVSMWRRAWDGDCPAHIGGERVLKTTIQSLAAANVVTESAVRLASNQIRFANRGIGRASILPLRATDWSLLGPRVYKSDYATVHADLRDRMPYFARNRVETDATFVFEIAKVLATDYLPGAQTLLVEVHDRFGNRAIVQSEYRAEAPGALSVIAETLGSATAVSGHARLRDGKLTIEPLAIATDTAIVLPQLVQPSGPTTLRRTPNASPDRLVDTINAAITVVADLAHQGLAHPRTHAQTMTQQAAQNLLGIGMPAAAESVTELADALAAPDMPRRRTAWLSAATQLITAAEFA